MEKLIYVLLLFTGVLMLSACDKQEDHYMVRFNSNGGSEVSSIFTNESKSIILPNSPFKEGYDFDGWFFDNESFLESFSNDSYINNDFYTDITVYAKWTPQHNIIEYVDYDGTVLRSTLYTYGEDLTTISEPDNPTREGYTFNGWSEFTPDFMGSVMLSIVALYIINDYTIEFVDYDGSILNTSTHEYLSDISGVDEQAIPTRENYVFSGWLSDISLNTKYLFTTMPADNIMLYAKWEPVDFSEINHYLNSVIPSFVSSDIDLPTSYLEYEVSWKTSDPKHLSDEGIYNRPYQSKTVTLTATIRVGEQSETNTFNLELDSYKSLSAPLTSSYIYRNYYTVNDSFFTSLDIINCAFVTADASGSLSGTTVLNNISTYIMPKAKEHGNWVLFSIAPDSDWSQIASSTSTINDFADNIVSLINMYGFDGVDIDWETPSSSESLQFTEMMQVIYTKVKANNPNHLVTAAIAGGMWQPVRYDLENSHQYIDYINMMTYGMVSNNGYYQNALSKSTSFDDSINLVGKTLISCSIEESIGIYNGYGIPNSKIIVGVAFYGIQQTRSYDSLNETWSSWSKEKTVSYSTINSYYMNNSNYTYHYDETAGVPYLLSNDGTTFLSFDDPRSIIEKGIYISDNNLGGMMYWENGLNTSGELLEAMAGILN
jgi:chitinase